MRLSCAFLRAASPREIVNPEGMRRIRDYPNLTAAMERAGWPKSKVRKIMGENWLRFLDEVWTV